MYWITPWLVGINKVDRCRVSATYIYNIARIRMSFKRTGIPYYEKWRNTVKTPLGTNRPVDLSSIRGYHIFTENQWSKFRAMECWRLLGEIPQAWMLKSLIFFLSNATTCPCGLRGPPSWAWQECNRLLIMGRPWDAVTLSRWCEWW